MSSRQASLPREHSWRFSSSLPTRTPKATHQNYTPFRSPSRPRTDLELAKETES
jgi:hypothetical protein